MRLATATLSLVLVASCGELALFDDGGADGSVIDAKSDQSVVVGDGGTDAWDALTEAALEGGSEVGTLTVLAPAENPPGPNDIAIDSTNVYWITGAGAVRKCAVGGCGGAPTTLADGLGPLCGVAIDLANVYWTACDTSPAVMKCAIAGCSLTPTTIASSLDYPQGIVSNGTNVYFADPGSEACWAAPDAGTLNMCSANGCGVSPTVLASSQCGATRIAVDSANVYWSAYTKVLKCGVGGCGNSPTVLANSKGPFGIAVDSTNVYWTDPQASSVMKCSIGGCGGTPTILATGQGNPTAIATDGINVYWTNASAGGQIMKCAVAGCVAPTVIASAQNWPSSIAVDVSSVYWGTSNAIVKLTPK